MSNYLEQLIYWHTVVSLTILDSWEGSNKQKYQIQVEIIYLFYAFPLLNGTQSNSFILLRKIVPCHSFAAPMLKASSNST